MIHPIHLRQLIIDPVLKYLDMYSLAASNLMMGTAATESHLGFYLMQVDSQERPQGPALGIYQMEPATHDDIWKTYLEFRGELLVKVSELLPPGTPEPSQMIHNMKYATAMARIKYWRDPEPLPQPMDIEGLAHIWKNIYNSKLGKGTVEEFILNYERFVSNG